MPFKSSGRGAYGPQGQKVIKGPLAPVWVTSGSLTAGSIGSAYSVQLTATDDSGDAPTYSIASGSLPSGLSLSSSGLISGTVGGSAGTFTFTVNATDVNGRSTTSSSLSITTSSPQLYSFTSATFGTGGQTGQDGPNITQARNAVGNPSWASSYLNMNVNGVQRWTVPATGTYTITCAGARGGSDGSSGGNGRVITAVGTLTQGEVIFLVVGQPGGDSGTTGGGGGGGGSFVYRGASETSYNLSDLIVAAGGGSGANNNAGNSTGETATFTPGPNFGPSNNGNSGWAGPSSGRTVNPDGYGGLVAADGTISGAGNTNNYAGGAGAGFFTRGEGMLDRSGNQAGGGYGGNSGRDTSSNSGGSGQPWRGGQGANGRPGGFGGGGGAANDCGGTGGGGGYSGGYAQGCYTVNGAGSSHTAQGFSKADAGTNSGTGYITITKN